MNMIFLGAPGAGKGTQAAMVAEEKKLAHIATGDMFRQAQKQSTDLAKEVKYYMEKGELVPDETTIKMVMERIAAPDCKEGVIFDGFPRSLRQAKALDKALSGQRKAINRVIYIKVAEEELLIRLSGRWICRQCQAPYHEMNAPPKIAGKCDKCGGELYQRADDNIETIKNRLQVYFKETAPLIDYYSRTGKLLEVDGVGELAEVKNRILKALSGSISA